MGLPLILAAMAGGRALYGAVNANQKKKRNEGYIEQEYELASTRMKRNQSAVRQGTLESLNARGLQPSPIQRAMLRGKDTPVNMLGVKMTLPGESTPAPRPAAHTLGGQVQEHNEQEFALERKDLNQQRERALGENTAMRNSAYVESVLRGAESAATIYGASQDLAGMRDTPIAGAGVPDLGPVPSIQSTPNMSGGLTGVDDPSAWWGGVSGIDPLRAPGSSWNREGTRNAVGEPNADFHV